LKFYAKNNKNFTWVRDSGLIFWINLLYWSTSKQFLCSSKILKFTVFWWWLQIFLKNVKNQTNSCWKIVEVLYDLNADPKINRFLIQLPQMGWFLRGKWNSSVAVDFHPSEPIWKIIFQLTIWFVLLYCSVICLISATRKN
jgi:hypothetical protein